MPTQWNHALPRTEKAGTVTTNTTPVPTQPATTNGWWWWWVGGAILLIFLLIVIALIIYWSRPQGPTIYTDECGNIIGTSSGKREGLACQPKCPVPQPTCPIQGTSPLAAMPVNPVQYVPAPCPVPVNPVPQQVHYVPQMPQQMQYVPQMQYPQQFVRY